MRSPLNALRRLVVPVAASVAAVVAPLALATPAQAASCTAPELVSAVVDTPSVVVGTAEPVGFVVTATVRTHGCAVTHVDTDVFLPTGFSQSFRMERLESHGGVATYEVGVRVDAGAVPDADAGRWRSAVYVSWAGGNTNDDGPSFRVRRATMLRAAAAPASVGQGQPVTVRSRLTRISWDSLVWSGLRGQRVRLQFKPAGGRWGTVGTATTGRSGAVARTVTARHDGCYRFVFAGTSTTAPTASRPTCVEIG